MRTVRARHLTPGSRGRTILVRTVRMSGVVGVMQLMPRDSALLGLATRPAPSRSLQSSPQRWTFERPRVVAVVCLDGSPSMILRQGPVMQTVDGATRIQAATATTLAASDAIGHSSAARRGLRSLLRFALWASLFAVCHSCRLLREHRRMSHLPMSFPHEDAFAVSRRPGSRRAALADLRATRLLRSHADAAAAEFSAAQDGCSRRGSFGSLRSGRLGDGGAKPLRLTSPDSLGRHRIVTVKPVPCGPGRRTRPLDQGKAWRLPAQGRTSPQGRTSHSGSPHTHPPIQRRSQRTRFQGVDLDRMRLQSDQLTRALSRDPERCPSW